MKRLFIILLMLLVSRGAVAKVLSLSAFPKLPHAVEDACWIEDRLYFLTAKGVFEAALASGKWDITAITMQGPQETMWSITCGDLLPTAGVELVVSRVRSGVWRSFVLTSNSFPSEHNKREGEAPRALPVEGATRAPTVNGKWKIALDDLPFALRRVTWDGQSIWVGDARFPQNTARGEFFKIEAAGDKLKLGAKIKLPRGSVLDNWLQLPTGDVAVLRDRHVEFFGNAPKWRLKSRSAGGSQTTLCAESQPTVFSSVGGMVCRQLAPSLWNDILIVPDNKLIMDQVLGRVPMIDRGEIELLVWDSALEGYQVADRFGPLPGELTSYFIDKNPMDGLMTLFLVAQIRSAADAVGGMTNYSVLVPVSLDAVQKVTQQ